MHVSNLYLDVKPVVRRLAQELGAHLLYIKNEDVDRYAIDASSWMLLTKNATFLANRPSYKFERKLPLPGPLWTDDYSSIFSLLKLDD